MAATATLVAVQGDRLDQLITRGGLGPADLGPVLELNPGLASRGVLLVEGTVVVVPPPPAAAPRTLDVVQLWD